MVMFPKLLKPVALALAVGIVLMLAAVTGSAFAHELQHAAHHNARMHATGICAWMCATAGTIATPVFAPIASLVLQESIPFAKSQALSALVVPLVDARAPPILF
jgi:hypothetical protein